MRFRIQTFVILGSLLLAAIQIGCENTAASEEEDKERLQQMKNAVLQLIGDPLCNGADKCRSIEFGAKPCGGPWEYLIYSTSRTDSVKLAEKVAEYNRFQDYMNRRYGYMSDCSIPARPIVGCVNGRCVNTGRI